MPPPFSRKRAILIGVDKYVHVPQLQYCGKDVRDVAKALRDSLEFSDEDVLEFTPDSALKPERTAILHHLGEFLKTGIAEDELLVCYFSGHGMIEGGEDYLLPVDASPHDLGETGISVNTLVKKLTQTRCKNIVMFIDACREALWSDAGAKSLTSVGEFSQKALSRNGIVTFFSCDPREKSYEIAQVENGAFTHCVLEAIQKGDCPTVENVDRHLQNAVPLLNEKYKKPPQRPFTIIQPAEKAQLAIFYSEIKQHRADTHYDSMDEFLGELHNDGKLDSRYFNDAVKLLERARSAAGLTADEKKRFTYIQQLCEGKLYGRAFGIAWEAVTKSRLKAAPKPLDPNS